MTFIVTPQIASDSVLTLSLTPMLNAPRAAIEADMLARVADGETLVISGFTHEPRGARTQERRASPAAGSAAAPS